MNESIKAKSDELTAASATLAQKNADHLRLIQEIASTSARVQSLLAELTALRSRLPAT